MSGPVFVLDAQSTPLMPMGAAHARVLLARGTAQRIPHHAFTIIQLSRSYIHPVVHPVLLHIRMYWHTATLLLLVEQRCGVVPLLRLLMERGRAGWFHHIYPYHRHARNASTDDAIHRPALHTRLVHLDSISVRRLSQVIASLRTLVPLSHVIVDIADSQQHVMPIYVDDVGLSGLQLTMFSPSTCPHILSPLIAATINVVRQHNWNLLPLFYASTTYPRAEDTAHITVSRTPSRRVVHSRVAIPEELLVVCHNGHHVQTGLYTPWRELRPPNILIPVALNPTHIVWQWNVMPRTSKCWPLQTNGIVFLPMRWRSS